MESKLSPKLKEVFKLSREEAIRLNHDYIGLEHILLGIIRDGDDLATKILIELGVDLVVLRRRIENAISDKVSKTPINANALNITKQTEKVMKLSVLEAKAFKSEVISIEHLMLSILRNSENIVSQVLAEYEISYENFKTELAQRPNRNCFPRAYFDF